MIDEIRAKALEMLNKPIVQQNRHTLMGRFVITLLLKVMQQASQISAEVRDGADVTLMEVDYILLDTLIGQALRGCTELAAVGD